VSGLTPFLGLFPRPANPATPRLNVKTRVTEALKTVGITAPIGAVSGAGIAEGITHLPGQNIVGLNSVAKFFSQLYNSDEKILNIRTTTQSLKEFLRGSLGVEAYQGITINNLQLLVNQLNLYLSKINDKSLHLDNDQLIELKTALSNMSEGQLRAFFEDPKSVPAEKLPMLPNLQSASEWHALPGFKHLAENNWLITHHIPVAGLGGLIGGLFTGLIGAGMSQRYAQEKLTAQTSINDLQQELDEQLRKEAADKQLAKIEKLLDVVENEKDTLENKRLLALLEAEVKHMTAELATTKGGAN
jgi:hypothetical protein